MIRIINYTPLHKADFKRINTEAITELFTLETHDLEHLDAPEMHILPNGGTILLAEHQGLISGTVGLIRSAPGDYELVKLAVIKPKRTMGLGRQLCQAAIDYAWQQQASRIWLEANRRLQAAIHIYETLGFEQVALSATHYKRANVRMELHLSDSAYRRSRLNRPGWLISNKFE